MGLPISDLFQALLGAPHSQNPDLTGVIESPNWDSFLKSSMLVTEEEDAEDGEGVVRASEEIRPQAQWNQVS